MVLTPAEQLCNQPARVNVLLGAMRFATSRHLPASFKKQLLPLWASLPLLCSATLIPMMHRA